MQNRFERSHVIQFILFIDFYLALKRTDEMIFFAIDALSSFDQRITDAFTMKIRASCAASIVFARFIYMFVTLTVET
jgi:hypothetical protein